jgi:hypothetical protein
MTAQLDHALVLNSRSRSNGPVEHAGCCKTALTKPVMREGNPGDDAVNDWIAAMLGIYCTLTGKEPATSVGAPMRANEGKAAGPLIRFLQAAGQPLNIDFSEDAWRSRVRTLLKDSTHKN